MKLKVEPYEYVTNTPKGKLLQLQELEHLAENITGNIIEIGSFLGRATIIMARGLVRGKGGKIFTIDPHTNNDIQYQKLINNIKQCPFRDHVQVIRDYSYRVWENKQPKIIFKQPVDMIFIDGNHWYEDVKRDTEWIQLVRKGGVVAFHDYCLRWKHGVVRAVKEYWEHNDDIEFEKLIGSLIIFKKL